MTVATVQYNDNLLTHSVLALHTVHEWHIRKLQPLWKSGDQYTPNNPSLGPPVVLCADKITNKRHLKNMMGKVKMLKMDP